MQEMGPVEVCQTVPDFRLDLLPPARDFLYDALCLASPEFGFIAVMKYLSLSG